MDETSIRTAAEALEAAKTDRDALAAENARLREALAPFDTMAGELFSRNWNRGQVVMAMDNPGKPCRLTFDDFLEVRAALAAEPQGES